jgi:hypothetical protein
MQEPSNLGNNTLVSKDHHGLREDTCISGVDGRDSASLKLASQGIPGQA